MSLDSYDFVEWREDFVSQERGSRVVHYYLVDSSGNSFLAAIGTERSLRHMLYVISDDFSRLIGYSERSDSSLLKWRSRRELVDWLTSFLPRQHHPQNYSNSPSDSTKISFPKKMMNGMNDNGSYRFRPMDNFNWNLKSNKSDIAWSGNFWTCGKQLRHYQSFCRNGTTIPSRSFVLVMSEDEENCYLAYLEDMYEDKKGQKKVKVRWFHRHQEVNRSIPPPKPHPREAFITPYSQVISAECVDDLATVLTPEHYEKCLAVLQYDFPDGVYLCYRQYNKNKFNSFDLSTLSGYLDQTILSCLDICMMSWDEEFEQDGNAKVGFKRVRSVRGRQRVVANHLDIGISSHSSHALSSQQAYGNLKFGHPSDGRRPLAIKFIGPRRWPSPFKVEEKVECLCQDSGIRGCWFRCTILQMSHKQLKIWYEDVQNEDGNGNLEEWIPAFRPAACDKLGMRCSGRLTVRPCRPCDKSDCPLPEIGTPVDAWWNDGWWEGVVIGIDINGDDGLQVYFPGEDFTLICNMKDLRISKDWIGNKWVDIETKPDVLSIISAVSQTTKLSSNSMSAKGSDSGGSTMTEKKDAVELNRNVTEEEMQDAEGLSELVENVNQESPRKRQREGEGLDIAVEVKEVGDKVDDVAIPVEVNP